MNPIGRCDSPPIKRRKLGAPGTGNSAPSKLYLELFADDKNKAPKGIGLFAESNPKKSQDLQSPTTPIKFPFLMPGESPKKAQESLPISGTKLPNILLSPIAGSATTIHPKKILGNRVSIPARLQKMSIDSPEITQKSNPTTPIKQQSLSSPMCESPPNSARSPLARSPQENKENACNNKPPELNRKKLKSNSLPEFCSFKGSKFKLTLMNDKATMNDVAWMSYNDKVFYIYKVPKPHCNKFELANSMNQYMALVQKGIPVAQIYNNPIEDGFVVEEIIPEVFSKKFSLFTKDTQPYFVAYGQFIKKVIESGIKNVDLKLDNIGIRRSGNKFELCLFDFDGEQADETIERIKQAIRLMFEKSNYNTDAVHTVLQQLKGVQGAAEIINYCETLKPFEEINPDFLNLD